MANNFGEIERKLLNNKELEIRLPGVHKVVPLNTFSHFSRAIVIYSSQAKVHVKEDYESYRLPLFSLSYDAWLPK